MAHPIPYHGRTMDVPCHIPGHNDGRIEDFNVAPMYIHGAPWRIYGSCMYMHGASTIRPWTTHVHP